MIDHIDQHIEQFGLHINIEPIIPVLSNSDVNVNLVNSAEGVLQKCEHTYE